MKKKEDLGIGMIVVFILAALFFVTLMVPFDTPTGNVVLGVSEEDIGGLNGIFYQAHVINFIVLMMISVLIVGGSLEIMRQRKEAEAIMEELPLDNRVELRDYVEGSLAAGMSREEIKDSLLRAGWDRDAVDAVLRIF